MSTTNPEWKTTEWEDILMKKGIIPKIEKEKTEVELSNMTVDFAETLNPLDYKTCKELKADAEATDDLDAADDLDKIRQRRIEEMKKKHARATFGRVVMIHKDSFIPHVTEASKTATVICHLYQDFLPECTLINKCFEKLASLHRDVKFCKGIATDIIKNFPDSQVPAIFIYQEGVCKKQLVGLTHFLDSNGRVDDLNMESLLFRCEALTEKRLEDAELEEASSGEEDENSDRQRDREYSSTHLFRPTWKNSH